MIFQRYLAKRFHKESQAIITIANHIIQQYHDEGYDLTLRQLYYQFVARGYLPNSDKSYNRLGSVVSNARLAGELPWDAIVDRTRPTRENPHWDGPEDIIKSAASSFRIDVREQQENYIEVWVEKEALAGVVGQVCEELDVPYLSCRGYVSQSAMWRASIRFHQQMQRNRNCFILHLGDHDPSGIDMTRDIQDRLNTFWCTVDVRRIALNMNQIEQYNPPPNPAKITDSRSGSYIDLYGDESWELDALEPSVIDQLIRDEALSLTDTDLLEARKTQQEHHRSMLQRAVSRWDDIIEFLGEE